MPEGGGKRPAPQGTHGNGTLLKPRAARTSHVEGAMGGADCPPTVGVSVHGHSLCEQQLVRREAGGGCVDAAGVPRVWVAGVGHKWCRPVQGVHRADDVRHKRRATDKVRHHHVPCTIKRTHNAHTHTHTHTCPESTASVQGQSEGTE